MSRYNEKSFSLARASLSLLPERRCLSDDNVPSDLYAVPHEKRINKHFISTVTTTGHGRNL